MPCPCPQASWNPRTKAGVVPPISNRCVGDRLFPTNITCVLKSTQTAYALGVPGQVQTNPGKQTLLGVVSKQPRWSELGYRGSGSAQLAVANADGDPRRLAASGVSLAALPGPFGRPGFRCTRIGPQTETTSWRCLLSSSFVRCCALLHKPGPLCYRVEA